MRKLNIEISENEVRKDFSKTERIEYARRLERIESEKAKERQAATHFGANVIRQNSDTPNRTDVKRDCLQQSHKIQKISNEIFVENAEVKWLAIIANNGIIR